MPVPTTHQQVLDAQALGREIPFVLNGVASGGTTASTTAAGGMTLQMLSHGIGASLPGTRVGPLIPGGTFTGRDVRLALLRSQGTRIGSYALGNFVKLGTLNFTATGQRFTHHSSTGPYSKKQMNQQQPIHGPLVIDFQQATSVTAPIIGSVKYVNQDGVTVTGTQTWTAPNIATVLGSGFLLPLDAPDSGIQDVIEINVTTASTTGQANVYLLEHLDFCAQQTALLEALSDSVFGGFSPTLVNPPTAASGTADVRLLPYCLGVAATNLATIMGTMVTT